MNCTLRSKKEHYDCKNSLRSVRLLVYVLHMSIKIITVGNKSSPEMTNLIDEYTKRLPKHIDVQWRFIKHAAGDATSSTHQESENILKMLDIGEYVILLDETGKQLDSPGLSQKLFEQQKDVTIIIGGAYGVTDAVKQRADFVWSLSPLVFPHQIVRLMLAEQLYRAYAISVNHPYHHR